MAAAADSVPVAGSVPCEKPVPMGWSMYRATYNSQACIENACTDKVKGSRLTVRDGVPAVGIERGGCTIGVDRARAVLCVWFCQAPDILY